MAKKKVRLETEIRTSGTRKATKEIQTVNQATKNLTKEQSKLNRNLRGTAQSANRTGKDFSRMSQGMGGLVQQYATIVANVYALSAAFNVLSRAADLSSMLKSAENYSNKYGISVRNLTTRLQKATGGAFDLAEALPSINKAIATGLSVEKIEKLGIAATKASQTFGGTASDALNRFISAAQRGRVEVIQTLGIVLRTDQVYEQYAASVGKTVKELTAFDKQQAIVNATIEESERVLGAIVIDPNPFKQFLTTLTDVKNELLTFATDTLTPFLNFFNQSKTAALALIGVLVRFIGGKILPQLGVKLKQSQQVSIAATQEASRKIRAAKVAETKFLLEEDKKVAGKTKSQLMLRSLLFEKTYRKELSQYKAYKNHQLIIDGQYNMEAVNLRRALMAKEIKLRLTGQTKGRLSAFEGIRIQALINEYNRLTVAAQGVSSASSKVSAALAVQNSTMRLAVIGTSQYVAKLGAVRASMLSIWKSSVSQGIGAASQGFLKGLSIMTKRWGIFFKSILTGSMVGARGLKALATSVGVLGTSLASLASIALSVFGWVSIAVVLWEQFGDSIMGVTKEAAKFRDESEESNKVIQDNAGRLVKFYADVEEQGVKSYKKLGEALTFLRGSLDEFLSEQTKLRESFISGIGGIQNFKNFKDRNTLQKQYANELNNIQRLEQNLAGIRNQGDATSTNQNRRLQNLRDQANIGLELGIANARAKELKNNLDSVQFDSTIMEGVDNNLASISTFVSNLVPAFDAAGLNSMSNDLSNSLTSALEKAGISGTKGSQLLEAFFQGADKFAEVSTKLGIDDTSKVALLQSLDILVKELSNKYDILVNVTTERQQFEDLDKNIGTYLDSIAKKFADKTVGKEFFTFLDGANAAAENLIAQLSSGKINVLNLDNDSLNNLKLFLGIEGSINDSKFLNTVVEKYKNASEIILKLAKESANLENTQRAIAVEKLRLEESFSDQVEKQVKLANLAIKAAKEQAEIDKNNYEIQIAAKKASLAKAERDAGGRETTLTIALANEIAALEHKKELSEQQLKITKKQNAEEIVRAREGLKIAKQSLEYETQVLGIRKAALDALNYLNKTGSIDTRIKNLREEYKLQKEIRDIQYSTTIIELEQQINDNIHNQQLVTRLRKLIEIHNATKGIVDAQTEVIQLQNEAQERENELQAVRNHVKALGEINLSIAEYVLQINRGSKGYKNLTASLNRINLLQKTIAEQELVTLETRRKEIENNTGLTTESRKRELEIIDLQIAEQKIKNIELGYQLDLQNRINAAREKESTFGGFLSPSNFALLGESFGNELNKQFARLEPAILTFTKGLVNTVESTVDAIIDTAMETGFSKFGRTLRRELEKGIKQALGDTLKNNIKGLINQMVQTAFPKSDQRSQADAAIQKVLADLDTKFGDTALPERMAALAVETNNHLVELVSVANQISMKIQPQPGPQVPPVGTGLPSGVSMEDPFAGSILSTSKSTTADTAEQNGTSQVIESQQEQVRVSTEGNRIAAQTGTSIINQLLSGESTLSSVFMSGFQALISAIISSATASSTASTAGSIAGAAVSAAANGGIMPGSWRPLADGGVVRKPTLGLIGEGKRHEAVVPLPNNRAIPVDLGGQKGDTINIRQSFDFSNADENAIIKLRQEARNIEDRTFNRIFSEINRGGKYAKIVGRR